MLAAEPCEDPAAASDGKTLGATGDSALVSHFAGNPLGSTLSTNAPQSEGDGGDNAGDPTPPKTRISFGEEIARLGLQGFLSQVLGRREGLTTLDLSENAIGDEGAALFPRTFEGHPHLRRLNLHRTGLGPHGFSEVGKLCHACPALEALVLAGNSPGPGPLPEGFCSGVEGLRVLHLGDCGLTPASLPPLFDVLSDESAKIERLNLINNKMGAPAVMEVCRGLRGAPMLHTLEIGGNELGPKGGELFAQELAKMPQAALRTFVLDHNGLAFRGCLALLRLLSSNAGPPLGSLDLRDNGLTIANCKELCNTVHKNFATETDTCICGGAKVKFSWRQHQGHMSRSAWNGRDPANVYWH